MRFYCSDYTNGDIDMKAEVVMIQEFPVEDVLRLRVDTFREPGESGYEEHHVQVPVFPEPNGLLGGYPGEIVSGEEGTGEQVPFDPDDYKAWVEVLPKVWQNNPCLCQFIKVPIGTHQLKVREVIQAHLQRVKDAPIDPATGFPNVLDKSIEKGLDNHLSLLGINRMRGEPRSIEGMASVIPDHKLLGVSVTE